MDQDYIPKLFEAFSQEDLTSTNQYGGSGLGMAITKNIVEMMGGEIKVESEKGLGSTFIVSVSLTRVPKESIPMPVKEELPAEALSLEGRHLLVVEDNDLNAEILIDLLEMEDISTEWAENGRIAVMQRPFPSLPSRPTPLKKTCSNAFRQAWMPICPSL